MLSPGGTRGQRGPIDHLASHDDQIDGVVGLDRLQRIGP